MGTTVFYGAFLVFMVIVVDLLYGLIDPRVRLE
jgi:ABC-type dipeptide/oligopeptide/nickel transport system permease component